MYNINIMVLPYQTMDYGEAVVSGGTGIDQTSELNSIFTAQGRFIEANALVLARIGHLMTI